MKKILLSSILVISCFLLICGCGNKAKDNKDPDNSSTEGKIQVYSDNTKIVYNNEDLYLLVYYYNSNNEITGLRYYYEYENNKKAIESLPFIEESANNLYFEGDVKEIRVEGQYVVIEFDKPMYENRLLSEIKQSFAYLEEVTK